MLECSIIKKDNDIIIFVFLKNLYFCGAGC